MSTDSSKDKSEVVEGPKGSSDQSSTTTTPAPAQPDPSELDVDVDDSIALQNLKYVTKNKTMSYFGASVQNAGPKEMNAMSKKLDFQANNRKSDVLPCGYYDNYIYPHRKRIYEAAFGKGVIDDLAMTMSPIEDGEGGEQDIADIDKIFRIGDCNFIIPPEFISVNTTTNHDSIQGIRASGSTHIKHGYSTKEIQINAVFNGMNQINGYEVESPFAYTYHLDGLRSLIAQMKYTPFVPVENNVINFVHDVDNVALRNITVQTIPGFPETLNVIVSMQEFNAEAYTCMPNSILTDCIDWDLYRYYVQRPLRKGNKGYLEKITTPQLTSNFTFKILSEEAIAKADKAIGDAQSDGDKMVVEDTDLHVDMFDDSNYLTMVTDKDNISLTGLSFSMGNIMPNIQLSAHESPTMQYLGATDTTFSFSFETTDESTASMFNHLMTQNNHIVRTNRYKNGVGFIKIENELVQLTGTKFLLLTGVNVVTVPDFPGLYNINVQCVSFNPEQKNKEKLVGMRPFPNNRKGTKDDLISQSSKGIGNKIYQDSMMEQRIMELELYPDLALPTYREVDDAMFKIAEFRAKKGLSPLNITSYPRQKMVIPGSINATSYEGFVDPDFYVYYPNSFSDLQQDEAGEDTRKSVGEMKAKGDIGKALNGTNGNIMNMLYNKPLKPDAATEPEFAHGYENPEGTKVHRGFLSGFQVPGQGETGAGTEGGAGASYELGTGGGDNTKTPTSVKRITGNPFLDFLCDRADSKCGYVFGSKGEFCTKAHVDSMKRSYSGLSPNSFTQKSNPWKWIGRQVFDCSGFVWWGLRQIGMKVGYNTAKMSPAYGTRISLSSVQPGDLVFHNGHVAVCLGNGKTVEAMGTAEGVCYGKVRKSFTGAVRIKGLQEACRTFLAKNPNFYKGTGSGGLAPSSATPPAGNNNVVLANFGGSYKAVDRWNDLILKHSKSYNLDPNFIKCIIAIESTGNPNLVSSGEPRCKGLMQIHQKWFPLPNPFDPNQNIEKGCWVLAKYGRQVGYEYKRWLTAFNAGETRERNIHKGTSTLPKETKNYHAKYQKLYAQLVAAGAKSGGMLTPTVGGMSGAGAGGDWSASAGGGAGDGTTEPEPFVWGYTDEDFKNPNRGKKHGDKPSTVNTDEFGKDFVGKVATRGENGKVKFDSGAISSEIKDQNDPDHVMEYMFTDATKYSMAGSLCRAFPSYIFMIIDEQADWIDDKKLWSNYYLCRNAIELSVHEAYDSPVHTMTATIGNFHNNLSKVMKSKTMLEIGFNDGIWGSINKGIYKLTGAIMDEVISDKMIEYKNILYDEIDLEEGARVHLRMGYGSNPARYPTCFNGTITQVADGEIISIAAQSDGLEFANNPVTDKTSATNKDIDLSDEVSNMISELLIKRESNFWYTFTLGNCKIKSRHGIEHFGIHWNGGVNIQNYKQYDLVKNIYKGTYKGVPFTKSPYNIADGEVNFKFFATGKTPWDIIKMCEKAMPDFVAYPRYFNFESRLFYGLPVWLCKYKYNMDTASGVVYENAKSFAQFHEISSLHSIIDNNIKIDTRDLATNMIGLYTVGGDMSSTPVIMSDSDIEWSKQVTKTIDTTSVQDFAWIPGFIDKFISWSGMFDNGKQLAINTCISELGNSWKNTYTGTILATGRPEIHAHDFVYVDDAVLYMSGPVTVREVVHSMSISTGFTTSIVPGLIANNTIKQSGLLNVIKSATTALISICFGKKALLLSMKAFSRYSKTFKASRKAMYMNKAISHVKNFTTGPGAKAFKYVKNGKLILKTTDFLADTGKLVANAKKVKTLAKVAKTGYNVFKVACVALGPIGWGTIAATFAIDILLNKIIDTVTEMFKYDHSIVLYPLVTQKPDGSPKAYVGNIKGGKKILPFDGDGKPTSNE